MYCFKLFSVGKCTRLVELGARWQRACCTGSYSTYTVLVYSKPPDEGELPQLNAVIWVRGGRDNILYFVGGGSVSKETCPFPVEWDTVGSDLYCCTGGFHC